MAEPRYSHERSATRNSSIRCGLSLVDGRRAADRAEAPGAFRLGPGRAGRRPQRTARSAKASAQNCRKDPRTPSRKSTPKGEIALCREQGIDILTSPTRAIRACSARFPIRRACCSSAARLKPADALAIGIVGTRHATPYGLRQAERLAASLARAGLTIISGLARGIDAAAHRGALAAGGRTLAVLASGVLNIYPPEHDKLADEVAAARGADQRAAAPLRRWPGTFPQRNRLISGLSLGVIVVEAAERSGALITARHAMEQGRDVFAVPGNVDSRTSRGCHRLIRDGAKLVEIGRRRAGRAWPAGRGDAPRRRPRGPPSGRADAQRIEQQVLDAIGSEATSIDEVIVDSGLRVAQVLSTLSVLEMRHLIRRLSGTTVIRHLKG